MSTKIKYNHNGAVEEIPLVEGKPAGKRLAIYHNGETYYAPLVDANDAAASPLHITFDGGTYALYTEPPPYYTLYYGDGTTETVPVRAPLDLDDYSNVTKAISTNGGTITAGASGVTIGGQNVSCCGGSSADVYLYTGGNISISGYSSEDYISLESGYSLYNTDLDPRITDRTDTLYIADSTGQSVGTINFDSEITKCNFYIDDIKRDLDFSNAYFYYYDETTETELRYNSTPWLSPSAEPLTSYCDFGKLVNNQRQGAPYYSNLQHVGTSQNYSAEGSSVTIPVNQTIIASSTTTTLAIMKFNSNDPVQSDKNLIIGGLGKKVFYICDVSCVIADFGVGATYSATTINEQTMRAKALARTTTQKNADGTIAYNRFDTGSYYRGVDVLQMIIGEITGIYYDKTITTLQGMFDIAVTYSDNGSSDTRVILLADVVNRKTNNKPLVYKVPTLDELVQSDYFKLIDCPNWVDRTLTADDKASLSHDWADFPETLRAQVANLYKIYKSSGFTCTGFEINESRPSWFSRGCW